MAPTEDEIDAARTPAGGWTRKSLAAWGVSWPPRKGWRRRLIWQNKRERAQMEEERLRRLANADQSGVLADVQKRWNV